MSAADSAAAMAIGAKRILRAKYQEANRLNPARPRKPPPKQGSARRAPTRSTSNATASDTARINATPIQIPGVTRWAAPEFGTRTKKFCSGAAAPVNQQVIPAALANNAAAAQVNKDLNERKLFKAR